MHQAAGSVVTVPGGPRSELRPSHRSQAPLRPSAPIGSLLEDTGFEGVVTFGAGFPFFNLYRLAVVASREAGDGRRGGP